MQDAHVIIDDFTASFTQLPSEVSRLSYFAVFDGHGGVRASKYAAQNLHLNLTRNFPKGEVSNMEKAIKKCLLMTFKQTDEGFLKQASSQKPAWKDGSTATCVLLVDRDLYVANLGDSRAILCRFSETSGKLTSMPLMKEHNPTQYDERMRIQKAGGTVRDGRVMGMLEVSRSIGDGQYKHCGVISVPDVRRCPLTSNDRYSVQNTSRTCVQMGSFSWLAMDYSKSFPRKKPSSLLQQYSRMRPSLQGWGKLHRMCGLKLPVTDWLMRLSAGALLTT
ncbi:integrin-linked kinase-associated serine/threonine phosphatase 2C isoform X1 [Pristis pectinata]|uniref:integrin-linked kinase-associated serine/threonine phosphatase 2C isoform X1 n=1 Tax=Pristis pectinata TaxID=685728 RepID=UPI00223C9785|nr:integrin-linked kinase-associated serine/threonine phosphatase 2C isoform X1 [Pristis pectinata]XP_051874002.1 integrin-linked kinase-associated serine/threonine phosphatase 2C isoform X1 [Pristis pectinata]